MSRLYATWFALAAVVAAAGCNGILGNNVGQLAPPDAGGSAGSGATADASAGASGVGGVAGGGGASGSAGTSGSGGVAGSGGDPCAGITCNKPPADTCLDTTHLSVHDVPGTCTNGTCSYATHSQQCTFACSNGKCTGVCTPGAQQCNGQQPQQCDATGTWQDNGAACANVCTSGACAGSCSPGAKQCSANTPQTCDSNGTWQDGTPCTNQACVAGACEGICTPGKTQCSGNGVQTCSAAGQWGTAVACSNQACVAGVCEGVCTPGTKQCSGNGVQTCSASGQWSAAVACTKKACVAGACQGVCAPGTRQCSGNSVQTCSSAGQWGTPTSCQYVCTAGVCTGVCAPNTTQCSGNEVQTCLSNAQWGTPVACSWPTPACKGGSCVGPPSCSTSGPGLTDCGPAQENCCVSQPVSGGTFYRDYDGVTSGFTTKTYPATVSSFRLDKYQITVGRFRKFVAAWDTGWRPDAGEGKHSYLNSGSGLVDPNNGISYEQGWDTNWNGQLASDQSTWDSRLACTADATWTTTPGATEHRPINCITWYEAYAFCIWDGGFLPSDAEWNYAAAGGSDQRIYPWSSPPTSTTIDCAHATYRPGGNYCAATHTTDVGFVSPKGDGRWGQADLAGNLSDWNLDYTQTAFPEPCTDCANIDSGSLRMFRGGSFALDWDSQVVSASGAGSPTSRRYYVGARCARIP